MSVFLYSKKEKSGARRKMTEKLSKCCDVEVTNHRTYGDWDQQNGAICSKCGFFCDYYIPMKQSRVNRNLGMSVLPQYDKSLSDYERKKLGEGG